MVVTEEEDTEVLRQATQATIRTGDIKNPMEAIMVVPRPHLSRPTATTHQLTVADLVIHTILVLAVDLQVQMSTKVRCELSLRFFETVSHSFPPIFQCSVDWSW